MGALLVIIEMRNIYANCSNDIFSLFCILKRCDFLVIRGRFSKS